MNRISTEWVRIALATMLAAVGGCAVGTDVLETSPEELDQRSAPIVLGQSATDYTEAALIDISSGSGGHPAATCSGAVISPRVVLTAGRCVYGFSSWAVRTPFAGNQQAPSSKGLVYDWNVRAVLDPGRHDIGLVVLDTPIRLDAYPTISTTKLPDRTKIANLGRVQDGRLSSSTLFISPEMPVTDGASRGFPFAYAVAHGIEPGDSGGPDFLGGTHTIVAVNYGSDPRGALLSRVDLLADWIQQQVEANGGAGTPAPVGGPAP
jgi:hypothetical protein